MYCGSTIATGSIDVHQYSYYDAAATAVLQAAGDGCSWSNCSIAVVATIPQRTNEYLTLRALQFNGFYSGVAVRGRVTVAQIKAHTSSSRCFVVYNSANSQCSTSTSFGQVCRTQVLRLQV
jgi:hypothetical protein